MSRLIDLTGQRFGRLTVIERVEDHIYPSGKPRPQWLCHCDCGNDIVVKSNCLLNEETKSCGCLIIDTAKIMGLNNKKYNYYDLSGEYGVGYTSQGDAFYFDLEDYDKIKNYCWTVNSGYLKSRTSMALGKKFVLFHKLVLPNAEKVDHINHNTLDNRKANLRDVNHQKNMMNRVLPKNNKSGVLGVHWHNRDKVWEVEIGYKKKRYYLGRFKDFDEAVKARKKAEQKYFGEYSYDNSMKLVEKNSVERIELNG